MATSSERASELLSDLYPERAENQYRTVCGILDDLLKEDEIVSFEQLVGLGYGVYEESSGAYKSLYRRAKKLNGRQGDPGRREIRVLAQSAIKIGIEDNKDDKLSAHFLRISFGQGSERDLHDLITKARDIVGARILGLTRNGKKFSVEGDNSLERVNKALEDLCRDLNQELWNRDNSVATCLAAITGQMSPWRAIDLMLQPHGYPYPYNYEVNNAIACLASYVKDGLVALSSCPEVPSGLICEDFFRFPLLSRLSSKSQDSNDPGNLGGDQPVDIIAVQLLLEIIHLRKHRK